MKDTRQDHRLYARAAARFIATVLGTVLLVQFALSVYAWSLADQFVVPALQRKAENAGVAMARNLTRAMAAGVPWDKLEGVQPYFDSVLASNSDLAYALLIDGQGHLLVRAGHGGEVVAPEQFVSSVNEVERRYVTYGQVQVGVDRRFITSRILTIRNDTGALFIASLVLAFELAWFAATLGFTVPMRHAAQLLGRMAAGDYRYRTDTGIPAPLANGINALQGRLNQSWAEVTRLAADQRRWAQSQPILKRLSSLYRFADGGFAQDLPVDRSSAVRALCFTFLFADALTRAFLPEYSAVLLAGLPAGLRTGLPLTAGLAGFVLALPMARDWTRQAGKRNAFVAGTLIAALALAATAYVSDAAVLLLGRTAAGVGYAVMLSSCLAAADAALGTERRNMHGAPAALGAAFLVAEISAPPLGGIIADTIGERAVFLTGGCLILVSACLGMVLLDNRKPDPFRAPFRALPAPTARAARERGIQWLDLISGSVARFLFGGFAALAVPLWLAATAHSTASIGRYQMVLAALPLVFGPLFTRLSWRSDAYVMLLVLAAGLVGGGMLPFFDGPPTPGRIGALALLGCGIVLGLAVQLVVVGRALKARQLRQGLAPVPLWHTAAQRGALALGPLAAGLLATWRGPDATLGILGAIFLAGAALFGAVLYRTGKADP
ncbi:MFS transporter [Massilia arenosa]|uniref:MFS transporter n=1 Tax=Zemynaea arenosa TaxID=2561931 RepID=A0A4Y9SED5_9BURK|nr:MFS transporter [Massilia arenosa]TFW19046.1 MFS transporter [Massilia arenosa]